MSSNVLKSLNDNSDDKTRDGHQKATKAQKLRSKSASIATTTTTASRVGGGGRRGQRCGVFADIISSAVWLNDVRAHRREDIDAVLAMANKHMIDGCDCVTLCVTLILIGNTHFETFLFNLKEFEARVAAQEEANTAAAGPHTTASEADKREDTSGVVNDIPVHKDSKLEANVMLGLVNMKNMKDLLAPMDEAMDHWSRAFKLSLKNHILTEESVIGFKLYYNLSSVIHIYNFYKRFEASLRAAKLMNDFCQYYSHKYSEISFTANYYLVKAYIQLGAVSKATASLAPLRPSSVSADQSIPETLGTSLNLLAKCEVDLLNGRTEKAAKCLQLYLASDYLQKLTINRYYVKALSLLMATKFPAKHFNYSSNFREFLEPIQMSVCILKRWHPWLSTTVRANNENQVVNAADLDPLWYKYGVMTFAFDALSLATDFYANVEIPIDSFYYYNSLIKLGRRYCATVRLSEVLLIGSQLDVICDHTYSAQTKLNNASLCLQSTHYSSDSTPVFTNDSSESTTTCEVKHSIDGQHIPQTDPEIDIKSTQCLSNLNSSIREDCEHKHSTNPWEMKRRLRNINNSLSDSEDYSSNRKKPSIDLQALIDENNFEEILDLVLTSIQIDFYKLLLDENDAKYIVKQIKSVHMNCLENYASHVLKPRVEELMGETSHEIVDNYPNYRLLKLKLVEKIASLEVELKEYEDAVNTCLNITAYPTYTYGERLVVSNLMYLEALSKFELYLCKRNINGDKLWIEFNHNYMECSDASASALSQALTPPRPQSMKALAPKAPKQKAFKNEEMNDYVTALTNKLYDELKPDQKTAKLFDNDSEMRSFSMSDLNSTATEKAVDSDIIVVDVFSKDKPNPNPTPTKRMTRSKTKLIENVEKPLKTTKRRALSSKSKPLSDVSNDVKDLNINCENLDEVFHQKLVISDEIKVIKKFSKEDLCGLSSLISILKRIFGLVSSHPSCKLYTSVHKLLSQIYSMEELKNEDIVGYHYSETNDSNYRYRNLFIAEKKRKLNRLVKYDLKCIAFNPQIIGPNNSYKTYIDSLPNDWRIIQFSTVNTDSKIPELMVCRFQKNRRPVFLKIKADPNRIIKHFMTHFAEIIERSNASIVNKDKETFWRLRYSLDDELMVLLRSVEETWFGAFRGILFGQIMNKNYRKMCTTLSSYINVYAKSDGLCCKSEGLLDVMVESLPSLKYCEYKTAMKTLFTTPSDAFITKCFDKYEQLFTDCFPIDNKELVFTTYGLSPVGLILDKSLEAFPLESLPSLQSYNQSLFRTPSLRILSLMYNTFKDNIYSNGVDEKSVYYVINPADNLDKTQEYFKESFTAMKEWNGVIGRVPPPQELKAALDSSDAYIFFGHGAGASYYRAIPEGLDGCSVNCAAVVMGCSSGKLFSDGKHLQSYGTPYRFMMNGSPCYVGVLWDVTDKDIDKFSDHLLTHWFSSWKRDSNVAKRDTNMSIASAVSLSRKSCRLKYLIGAAPVVYGLPLCAKIDKNESN